MHKLPAKQSMITTIWFKPIWSNTAFSVMYIIWNYLDLKAPNNIWFSFKLLYKVWIFHVEVVSNSKSIPLSKKTCTFSKMFVAIGHFKYGKLVWIWRLMFLTKIRPNHYFYGEHRNLKTFFDKMDFFVQS